MSRIVKAVNVMISNENKIRNVIRAENEYFFVYNNKYKWSVSHNKADDYYSVFYYPGSTSIKELASIPEENWEEFTEYVKYTSKDIKTQEAYDTFRELYTIMQEKLFGVDDAIDDILKDDDVF